MAGAWACVIHLDEGFAWLPQFCAPVFSVSFQPKSWARQWDYCRSTHLKGSLNAAQWEKVNSAESKTPYSAKGCSYQVTLNWQELKHLPHLDKNTLLIRKHIFRYISYFWIISSVVNKARRSTWHSASARNAQKTKQESLHQQHLDSRPPFHLRLSLLARCCSFHLCAGWRKNGKHLGGLAMTLLVAIRSCEIYLQALMGQNSWKYGLPYLCKEVVGG